jgi:DNA-binding HxlR family transcriptional regulator
MQRTRFGDMTCSIARTLDVVGEPWSPLIVRDVWVGINRFDQMQRDLGVSSKVLAERLRWLVVNGVLEKRAYSERPVRHEYLLTEKGHELCTVLMTITAWGDRWTAGDAGPPVLLRHRMSRLSPDPARLSDEAPSLTSTTGRAGTAVVPTGGRAWSAPSRR